MSRTIRRTLPVLLIALTLLLAACSRAEDIGGENRAESALSDAIQQRLAALGVGETLALADVTPFEWDTVHAFGGYTSGEDVNEQLGQPWAKPKSWVGEFETLLVFMKGDEVVGSCSPFQTFAEGGAASLTRDEATFVVEEINGARRLVQQGR